MDRRDTRDANLLAAMSLAISDLLSVEADAAAGHRGAGPAALVALHEFAGGRTMDNLRNVLGLTPSGAVRLVDRLVQDGLVDRRPGADKRSVALTLTPRGHRTAVRVQTARNAGVQRVLAELSEADRVAVRRASEALITVIARQRLVARRRDEPTAAGWLCRLCDFAACGRSSGQCPAASTSGASPSNLVVAPAP
jgi:DNA-binding MarR family transcriptional regulator